MKKEDIETITLFMEYRYEDLKEFLRNDVIYDLGKEADRLIDEVRKIPRAEINKD